MVHFKIICVTLSLIALVHCEPPVQGYHYEPSNYHSNSFNTPSSSYLPSKTSLKLPSSYLPPNSFTGNGHNYDHRQSNNHNYDHHSHHHGNENEVPKSYEFGYSVKDAKSGNDYDRREMSDGNVVQGEYRVQLPDGRTQIVTYHADWQTGFHANVRYEGKASYPEPSNQGTYNQGYNYNTPDYSGSLTGFQGNSGYKPVYGPPGYH
ncbi:pro-resilin-like [Vanessa cardui]|uniref:pro-resilin-like n=1 Tax=Vanessa cardui TaxID=171605 RepID=UPI001F133689|nr:pro-resilin-like [Vanessa cardui]